MCKWRGRFKIERTQGPKVGERVGRKVARDAHRGWDMEANTERWD